MSGATVAGEKRSLRSAIRHRLRAVDAGTRHAAGRAAAARVLALPEVSKARGVMAFLSFGDEIDTAPLIDELKTREKSILVPRLERPGAPLEVCRFPCGLVRSPFGIEQPAGSVAALSEREISRELDAVVVPGLAFDDAGRRLGYGAGSFDRFLAGRDVFTVGFAFDLQVVPRVPVEAHDVALDRVVTERRTLTPRAR